jgi:hypothetical protein
MKMKLTDGARRLLEFVLEKESVYALADGDTSNLYDCRDACQVINACRDAVYVDSGRTDIDRETRLNIRTVLENTISCRNVHLVNELLKAGVLLLEAADLAAMDYREENGVSYLKITT